MIKAVLFLLGLNSMQANQKPDEIEQAIKEGDLKILHMLTSEGKPITVEQSFKTKYLNLAKEMADKAKANLKSDTGKSKFNGKRIVRFLAGGITAYCGLDLIYLFFMKSSDELEVDYGTKVNDFITNYLSTIGAVLTSYGSYQIYKSFANHDLKHDYFKALAIESIVKNMPTK